MCVLGLALYSVCAPVGAKCDVNECTQERMDKTYGIYNGACIRNGWLSIKKCEKGSIATEKQIKEWDSQGSEAAGKTRRACAKLAQAKPELTNDQAMKKADAVMNSALEAMNKSWGLCSRYTYDLWGNTKYRWVVEKCTEFPTADQLQVWKVKGDQQKVAEAIERCKHMRPV